MKIAIIDSVKHEQEKLSRMIQKWSSNHNCEAEIFMFKNGFSFLEHFSNSLFDLIFMDFYLDTANGIEIMQAIRKKDFTVPIIFTTTNKDCIFELVHLHIFDYIHKPYTSDQIAHVLDEFVKLFPGYQNNQILKFSSGKKNVSLLTSNILYITADNNYTVFMTTTGAKRYRIFFSKVSALLTDQRFIVCTRGVAVNMDYIKRENHGIFEMEDGRNFPIHRNGRKQIVETFEQYQLHKSVDCKMANVI